MVSFCPRPAFAFATVAFAWHLLHGRVCVCAPSQCARRGAWGDVGEGWGWERGALGYPAPRGGRGPFPPKRQIIVSNFRFPDATKAEGGAKPTEEEAAKPSKEDAAKLDAEPTEGNTKKPESDAKPDADAKMADKPDVETAGPDKPVDAEEPAAKKAKVDA